MAKEVYGARVSMADLEDLLNKQQENNVWLPLCIWGRHGIGKTQFVRDYAARNNLEFCYLAPAQFEELGDLIGMPAIKEDKTSLKPPVWVPTDNTPGILLLDDINRADERILRGLMPLLQGFGMVSWKLPRKWRIVCTANPDAGDYSVTPMDPAILTRLMHVVLEFDPASWRDWAKNNGIEEQNIRFVQSGLVNLELERTTARTLSQFFFALQSLDSKEQTPERIKQLGDAFLDPETSDAYLEFRMKDQMGWVSPEEFLQTAPSDSKHQKARELLEKKDPLRQLFLNNMILHLQDTSKPLEHSAKARIKDILLCLENDSVVRLHFGRQLAAIQRPSVQNWLSDESISKLLF
ncbi:MAG: AAA domain-containing protein [Bacteroidetes bacterium]|nr:AAA domain-containing protein [Bacteroidota bacterium]